MGIGIIYISHFLNEVVEIADRITVIRDGAVISTFSNENHDTPIIKITQDMVGRPIDMFYDREKCPIGDVMLEVKDLNVYYGLIHALHDVSFSVEEGEVVALIGANGAGKTTTLHTITGLLQAKSGSVVFEGQDITRKPGHAIVRLGMSHVPEGRRVFANLTVAENLSFKK